MGEGSFKNSDRPELNSTTRIAVELAFSNENAFHGIYYVACGYWYLDDFVFFFMNVYIHIYTHTHTHAHTPTHTSITSEDAEGE